MLGRVLFSGHGSAIASTRCEGSQLASCQECRLANAAVSCTVEMSVEIGVTSREALFGAQCDFLASFLELVVQSARLLLDCIRQSISENCLSSRVLLQVLVFQELMALRK